ncbi:MAG: DNA polymerase IV, partial [Francisellaceae bacterium]|nr:DNA polymerase IV [Francisellaceae bacterium]
MEKKIIHIDMDSFFASIEIRDNPRLATYPVAVGGQANSRGIICTANYIAREYGVHSAMPTFQALRLCPALKILPPNIKKYKAVTQNIRRIFTKYSDLVEPMSIDEAYLDVSNTTRLFGSATLIANAI